MAQQIAQKGQAKSQAIYCPLANYMDSVRAASTAKAQYMIEHTLDKGHSILTVRPKSSLEQSDFQRSFHSDRATKVLARAKRLFRTRCSGRPLHRRNRRSGRPHHRCANVSRMGKPRCNGGPFPLRARSSEAYQEDCPGNRFRDRKCRRASGLALRVG